MARALAEFSSLLRTGASLAVEQEEALFPPLPVPALRPLLGELPRGGIVELTGPRSSGRLALSLYILAEATSRGEVCALLDPYHQFPPVAAARAGIQLPRLVWLRGQGRPEEMFRIADLLLHAGGFGVVVLDLTSVPAEVSQRIPLSWWYRFRRAVEATPTIFLLCAERTQARACCQLSVEIEGGAWQWTGETSWALLQGIDIVARLRKPVAPCATALSIRGVA